MFSLGSSSVRLGEKPLEHIVVVHGGVRADALETAMVVGEDQSVGRNHYAEQ